MKKRVSLGIEKKRKTERKLEREKERKTESQLYSRKTEIYQE